METRCEKPGLHWPGLTALGLLELDWYLDHDLRSKAKFSMSGDYPLGLYQNLPFPKKTSFCC